MEKMIMIPEWRYNKMMESYDKALDELLVLRSQLQLLKGVREDNDGGKD